MGKSVTLLKEALESEQTSVGKYEEALKVMAHEDSKKTVVKIIESKKKHIQSVKEILKQSLKCPALQTG